VEERDLTTVVLFCLTNLNLTKKTHLLFYQYMMQETIFVQVIDEEKISQKEKWQLRKRKIW